MYTKNYSIKIIIYFINTIVFGVFTLWYLTNETLEFWPMIFSMFILWMFYTISTKCITEIEKFFFLNEYSVYLKGQNINTKVNRIQKDIVRILWMTFVYILFINILFYIFIKKEYKLYSFTDAMQMHFKDYFEIEKFEAIIKTWQKNYWQDYKNIYPAYPFLIKILGLKQYFVIAGIIINNFILILSSIFLYLLVEHEYNRNSGLLSVGFMCVFPTSIFLIMPLSESLFLMFMLLHIYFLRKKIYYAVCITGIILGFIDVNAPIIVVLSIFEYIHLVRLDKIKDNIFVESNLEKSVQNIIKNDNSKMTVQKILVLVSILSVLIIHFMHIIVNQNTNIQEIIIYRINTFVENWGKDYFFSNVFELFKNFIDFSNNDLKIFYSVYIPSVILSIGIPFMIFFSIGKIRISYIVFSFIYFINVLNDSNILLIPRKLSVLFPIFIMLAILLKNKIFMILFFMMYIWYYIMFALKFPLY